jgi:hypothetical protein
VFVEVGDGVIVGNGGIGVFVGVIVGVFVGAGTFVGTFGVLVPGI